MTKVIIFLVLLLPITSNAQIENQPNWQFSYYGDLLFHPGFKVGYEIPLKNWVSTRKEKIKSKSYNSGIDFIYYWHAKHHHGLMLSPNVNYQRVKENGKFFQLKHNVGFHRSFIDGKTYVVDDNGKVSRKKLFGQNSIFNALSFGFGKDLRVNLEKPFKYYWEIGLNGRAPYNKTYLPGLHFGFGIHYFFKNDK